MLEDDLSNFSLLNEQQNSTETKIFSDIESIYQIIENFKLFEEYDTMKNNLSSKISENHDFYYENDTMMDNLLKDIKNGNSQLITKK